MNLENIINNSYIEIKHPALIINAILFNKNPLFYFQTTLAHFREPDFSVVRQHEEFVWLHDRFLENEEYAGIIVSDPSNLG